MTGIRWSLALGIAAIGAALLAMAALKEAGPARTHTVRLLVGTDEESGSTDVKQYLAAHAPPDLSLVLDSEFPVVVGEKGWDGLTVSAGGAITIQTSGAVKG